MKNIVFMTCMLLGIVYGDTDGIIQQKWTSVPKEIYNETQPLESISNQESSQVAVNQTGWNTTVQPVEPTRVLNQTKTLSDIKVLTQEVTTPTQPEKQLLTASEKEWIAVIETNVAPQSEAKKEWITVPQEVSAVETEKTIVVQETKSMDDGWVAASNNYNETAFVPSSKEETIQTPVEETIIVSDSVQEEIVVQESKIEEQKPVEVTSSIVKKLEQESEAKEIVGSAEILDSPFDISKYIEKVGVFISPLVLFIKDNTILSVASLSVLTGLFYLLFYLPLSKRIAKNAYEDEMEVAIPQAIQNHQHQQRDSYEERIDERMIKDASIITQSEYATLYGLINETFIFEKERILLSNDITPKRQNREIISLEWKFNQILHFSLPKLSTNQPKVFIEGIYDLLDEEITKDIIVVALKDILDKNTLTQTQKSEIEEKLKKINRKKVKTDETLINPQHANASKSNYANYMSQ